MELNSCAILIVIHQPELVVLVVLHVHVVVERPAPHEGGGALLAAVGPLGPLAVVPLDVLLQDGEAGVPATNRGSVT